MECYCPCSHWRGNHSLNPLPHLVQILSAQLKSPDLEETRGYVKVTHQVTLLSALAQILRGLNQLVQILTSHLKLLFSYYIRLSPFHSQVYLSYLLWIQRQSCPPRASKLVS